MGGWKWLAQWRKENRELRHLIARVEDALWEWQKEPKDENLMMGGLLAQVRLQWVELESNLDSSAKEFYQRSEDFRQREELLRANEKLLCSSFVSIISSEFRTPMTTIQSSAELLERYGNRFSEEKTQTYLRRIQEALSQMTQLLDDVVLVSKAEAGKLKFEPSAMDVVAFCRDIVESIQISARPKHTINLVVQGDCTNAQMDKKLLGHIITNLLSNAIKYSPQGGTVQFDLICNSSSAVFRIQDTGIGIPKQDIENLFDSFRRASNVGTILGTGLGLSIVKSCVDLHGGQIVVESEVGIGSTFIVTLPLN